MQIDRLAVSQNLKSGETVRVPFRSIVTGACEAYIATNGEGFSNADDEFECTLMGAYVPNPGQEEETVTSPWSEPASVRLPTKQSGISNAAADSASFAIATDGGRITVENPAGAEIAVYTVSGTLVTRSSAAVVATASLPSGIYLVATPAGTRKVAL